MDEKPTLERQFVPKPAGPAQPEKVECPHCSSTETELISHFGSMLLSAQLYCHDCRTVFDWIRWDRL